MFWQLDYHKFLKLADFKHYRLKQHYGTYVLQETISIHEDTLYLERTTKNVWHVFAHAGGAGVVIFGLLATFLLPYSELSFHWEAVNSLEALQDPTKEPFDLSFLQTVGLVAKIHEDEKAKKVLEKGLKELNKELEIFKILGDIRKLQPAIDRDKEKGANGAKKGPEEVAKTEDGAKTGEGSVR